MKRKFVKQPTLAATCRGNQCVQSSTGSQVDSTIRNYIERKVTEAEEFGFIDGDFFAYCVDEAMYYGSISKCIKEVTTQISEDPSLFSDEDDIYDAIYDAMEKSFGDSDEVAQVFEEHGKLDQIPEWYFE